MALDFAAACTTAALGKTGTVGRLEPLERDEPVDRVEPVERDELVDRVEPVEQIGLAGMTADSTVEPVLHDSQAVASSFQPAGCHHVEADTLVPVAWLKTAAAAAGGMRPPVADVKRLTAALAKEQLPAAAVVAAEVAAAVVAAEVAVVEGGDLVLPDAAGAGVSCDLAVAEAMQQHVAPSM